MYQNLLHDVAAERIADRLREAAARRRRLAVNHAPSAPAADRAGRRGRLSARRTAGCENC
jgi:hypothetical protein